MNLALLLGRLPAAAECARSAVDLEGLIDLAAEHHVVLSVDEDSTALSRLRDAGVAVHVSDKRYVYVPGDHLVDADTALATWVAARHAERPLDLVVAGSDRPTSGPVRDALAGVTWAVHAGIGPTAAADRLATDPAWVGEHGHHLWTAASRVAGADVVVSPIDPALLGLDLRAPAVMSLWAHPTPRLVDRVGGDLVVVAATGVSAAAAPAVLDGLAALVEIAPTTTVVILHAPATTDAAPVGRALALAVPPAIEDQVVLVPCERHGRAGAWLDTADSLVLAATGELLVPAIARRAAALPTASLVDTRRHLEVRPEALAAAPASGPVGRTALVPFRSPDQLRRELSTLRSSPDVTVAVIHAPGAVLPATDLADVVPHHAVDVVAQAEPRPPWDMADPRRVAGDVVAVRRRLWSVLGDELDRDGDLSSLVARLLHLDGARSHTLALVPRDPPFDRVSGPVAGGPLALLGGPLPTIRPPAASADSSPGSAGTERSREAAAAARREDSLRRWARTTAWTDRARIALPWRFGLREAVAAGLFPDDVARWARSHPVTERLRLVLPTRGGLLARAMEGRW